MTTQEVANQLVKLCKEGKFEEIYQTLFSAEIVSKEPPGGNWETATGFEEIQKKGEQWQEMVDKVITSEISEPIAAADHFAITMKSKVRFKSIPDVIDMDEICVYKVVDGKVVLEQFFYTPLPEFVS